MKFTQNNHNGGDVNNINLTPTAATETRSITGNYQTDGNRLVGYAAVWDSPTQIYENGVQFTEIVRAGAFTRSLANRGDILATYNHNPDALLARTSNNTLRLSQDATGLRFELDLPDTQLGRDLKALTSTGTLNGASFTFNVRSGGEKWNGKTRELVDLNLFELGPVAQPAYSSTSLGLRSRQAEQDKNSINLKRMRLMLLEKLNWNTK